MKRMLFLLAALAIAATPAAALTLYTAVDWENMNFNNGNLNVVGNPSHWTAAGVGWTGTAGAEMSINSGVLQIGSYVGVEPATTQSRWARGANYAPAAAYVGFQFSAKKGAGDPIGTTSWRLSVSTAAEGVYWAMFTGTGDKITCGNNAALVVDLTDAWQTITAFGDGGNNLCYYWLGGTYLGSAATTCNNRVRWVTFNSLARSEGSSYANLDNFSYGYGDMVPEPSGLLALATFGAGMFGYIRRRK